MKRYMGWDIDFLSPPGESAYASPDSVQWRVYKNPVALALGGVCAVLLEFADPRIRSGVWDHSVFPKDPLGRGQRTAMAAQIGVFGPRSAADQVIDRIGRLHARVAGETPSGRAYRASDPELANWVSATASYGFVMAYHRFVARLSAEEIDRFFADAVTVGGALRRPQSPSELGGFLRPQRRHGSRVRGPRDQRRVSGHYALGEGGAGGASLASGANGRGLHLPVACGGSRSFGPWARL